MQGSAEHIHPLSPTGTLEAPQTPGALEALANIAGWLCIFVGLSALLLMDRLGKAPESLAKLFYPALTAAMFTAMLFESRRVSQWVRPWLDVKEDRRAPAVTAPLFTTAASPAQPKRRRTPAANRRIRRAMLRGDQVQIKWLEKQHSARRLRRNVQRYLDIFASPMRILIDQLHWRKRQQALSSFQFHWRHSRAHLRQAVGDVDQAFNELEQCFLDLAVEDAAREIRNCLAPAVKPRDVLGGRARAGLLTRWLSWWRRRSD